VAASLLQFGSSQVKRYGMVAPRRSRTTSALAILNALQHASEAIQRAHQMVPTARLRSTSIRRPSRSSPPPSTPTARRTSRWSILERFRAIEARHGWLGILGRHVQIGSRGWLKQQQHDTAAASTKLPIANQSPV